MDIAREWPREWTRTMPQGYKEELKETIYEKKYFDNGGVARITINRAERMNAVTNLTLGEICDCLSDASHDRTIGVAVLTGAGDRAFCTGGDVGVEQSGGLRRQFEHPVSINRALRLCQKPVIAAVKGFAIGGGNHWAYFCDFTIAADNAIFGQNGPRVGSPADGYIVSNLAFIVGQKRAREMWMLCRQYTAQQAYQMGLVNAVVPLEKLDEEVDKWCQEVLEKSPAVISIVKYSFNQTLDYLSGTSHYVSNWLAPEHIGSEEFKEGGDAFKEKRPLNFGKFRRLKESP